MIASRIIERIAVTDHTGSACMVIVWSLTDTLIRGGKEVTIEKERWYQLSTGGYALRLDDETFGTIPIDGSPAVRLRTYRPRTNS